MCIREALEHDLTRFEWEQSVLQESEDILTGRLETIPHDEMRRRLGLDD